MTAHAFLNRALVERTYRKQKKRRPEDRRQELLFGRKLVCVTTRHMGFSSRIHWPKRTQARGDNLIASSRLRGVQRVIGLIY